MKWLRDSRLQAAIAGVHSIKAQRKSGEEARPMFQGMFHSAEDKHINLSDDNLVSEATLINFAGKNSSVLPILELKPNRG